VNRPLAAAALLALFCQCGDGTGTVFPSVGGRGGGLVQNGGAGGSAAATDPNMLVVTVDPGPPNLTDPYTNGLFASVTICVPGTSNCQTFDHLLVDTGSVGVRVLESELTLALPEVTNTSAQPLAECTPFVDGTAWGPVRMADVKLGEELAANLPIQLIGEKTFAMPASCTGSAITDFQTLAANGILGVGVYLQDCGVPCAPRPLRLGANAGLYYACSSTQSCAVADVPLAQQVAHPVAAFSTDHNGVVIQLPSIAAAGAPSVPGLMTFGIGTKANNELGSATVLALDAGGYISTTFPVGGTGTYTGYLDSGSNALFFLNAAKSNLPLCIGKNLSSFYCPASTTNLSALLSSINGASATIAFSVANAAKLNASAFAFSNLAGPMPGFSTLSDNSVPSFDWGLPFFFGRSVYTAIEGQDTPAGPGPYFAF
jgi:hypothetical protein